MYKRQNVYSADGDVNITLNNTELSAGHYPINIASGNTDVAITIHQSMLKGYCAFQLWSDAKVDVTDSTLIGYNRYAYHDSNGFTVIMVYDRCV